MTDRKVGLREKGIFEGRLRLQEVVGSCCMYNTQVRSAMCLLSEITNQPANYERKGGEIYQKVVRDTP
jgi:hypothetical protein